jgi:hypothetical protein
LSYGDYSEEKSYSQTSTPAERIPQVPQQIHRVQDIVEDFLENNDLHDPNEETDTELSRVYVNFAEVIDQTQFSVDDIGGLLIQIAANLGLDEEQVTLAYSSGSILILN